MGNDGLRRFPFPANKLSHFLSMLQTSQRHPAAYSDTFECDGISSKMLLIPSGSPASRRTQTDRTSVSPNHLQKHVETHTNPGPEVVPGSNVYCEVLATDPIVATASHQSCYCTSDIAQAESSAQLQISRSAFDATEGNQQHARYVVSIGSVS